MRLLLPILHVLEKQRLRVVSKTIAGGDEPRQAHDWVFGNISMASLVLIDLSSGMIVVWHQRERPTAQDILTVANLTYSFLDRQLACDSPDCRITFRVLDSCSVTLLRYMAIDILLQNVGGEHSAKEMPTQVLPIELVLE